MPACYPLLVDPFTGVSTTAAGGTWNHNGLTTIAIANTMSKGYGMCSGANWDHWAKCVNAC
jgi:hypothetical protein